MLNRVRTSSARVVFTAVILLPVSPIAATTDVLIDCSNGGTGNDPAYRGFYVPDYPGQTLDQVDLWLLATEVGDYVVRLIARQDTYDGDLVGSIDLNLNFAQTAPVQLPVSFVFPSPAVVLHSTLTFKLNKVSGPGNINYISETLDVGCPIIQTYSTNPPLDTYHGDGIKVIIYGTGDTPTASVTWGAMKATYR